VTNLLAGDLDSALHYFQESVLLKRACLGKNDITAAVSFVLFFWFFDFIL